MRILFLPRYGPQGASSRYRVWQYVHRFEGVGHDVEVHPLLDDRYLSGLYRTGHRQYRWMAKGYVQRLFRALGARRFDAVICEQEILPFLPNFVDVCLMRRSSRFFVDFDDAAHVKYSGIPLLRQRIQRIMAAAETVVVGNGFLAAYAQQFARRVSVIPTVVDIFRYPDRSSAAVSDQVRVAWIGTPVTARLLRTLLPVMKRLQSRHPKLVYRFIGAGSNFDGDGLRAEILDWSEGTEAELLAGCDIGIMPLPDTEFTRSKCGLKLIQYMACGLPVVASPVGVNKEIVDEGKNGYLASSEGEWLQKLDQLILDPELRIRFGKLGRAKVARDYSLDYGFSRWREILVGESRILRPFEHGLRAQRKLCHSKSVNLAEQTEKNTDGLKESFRCVE